VLKRGRGVGAALALQLAMVLVGAASCSLLPLFDGSYFHTAPTPEDLGFVPLGDNIALNARVFVSSSLEDNYSLVNEANPSAGTWRDYALWIGWTRTALNDGIVISPDTGGGGASSGRCTQWADPDQNLPAWAIYDFGRQVQIQTLGLFPRTDTPVGIFTNMPQDFAFYGCNSIDPSTLTQSSYSGSSPGEPWLVLPIAGDDDNIITHTGTGFPSLQEEQVYLLAGVQTFRYLMLYVTRAGGDFVQLAEFAVYAP